ncbi:MAG: hypothetical protein AAGE94_02955, partial [Acidobacteriota bacterium]
MSITPRLSTSYAWLFTLLVTLTLVAAPAFAEPVEVTTMVATSTSLCTITDAIATAQQGFSIGACIWDGDAEVML